MCRHKRAARKAWKQDGQHMNSTFNTVVKCCSACVAHATLCLHTETSLHTLHLALHKVGGKLKLEDNEIKWPPVTQSSRFVHLIVSLFNPKLTPNETFCFNIKSVWPQQNLKFGNHFVIMQYVYETMYPGHNRQEEMANSIAHKF